MADHGHPRLVQHTLDQPLAAARHHHIDRSAHGQHGPDSGAVPHRHKLDAALRQAGRRQPFMQGLHDGRAGMEALRPAAQDGRIARFQAEASGIGGHVRTGLVNDPDHAERRADALEAQPVGPRPGTGHGPHGIGQAGNFLQPPRDRFHALFVEPEPVDQRGPEMRGALQVARIRLQQAGTAVPHRLGRGPERPVLDLARRHRQALRRRPRLPAEPRHDLDCIFAHVTTRSSRWIISVRPR